MIGARGICLFFVARSDGNSGGRSIQFSSVQDGIYDLLTCVRDHSYQCVYTRGWAHPQRVSTTFFYSENLHTFFLVIDPDGVRTRVRELVGVHKGK